MNGSVSTVDFHRISVVTGSSEYGSDHNYNDHSVLKVLGCCNGARTGMGCFRGSRERVELDIEEANLKCPDSFSFPAHIIPINTRSTSLKNTNRGIGTSPDSNLGRTKESQGSLYHSAPLPSKTDSVSQKPDFRLSDPIWQSNGTAFGGPPLPLPLPADPESAARSVTFTSASRSFQETKPGSWTPYASEPRPLPLPKDQLATFRAFTREELAGACQNFSPELLCRDGVAGPVYRCRLGSMKDVDITRITSEPPKSFRKWIVELKSVARLRHPHLCDVLGFYVHISPPDSNPKPSSEQLLVYAGMHHGSLDWLLYGRTYNKPPLDWPSRVKIAFGAAQGLAFLHEISPVQVAYRCFETLNVQVDRDLNARLSDYCFARRSPANTHVLQRAEAYSAPETLKEGHVFPKSNVWSFGVLLLELLTGRKNMDALFPVEEQDLVAFSRSFLMEERKLYLIMDPELKGFYPTRHAKRVANLALECLQEDVVQRPTMREVVTVLRSVYSSSRSSSSTCVRLLPAMKGEEGALLRCGSAPNNDAPLFVCEERRRSCASPLVHCGDRIVKTHQQQHQQQQQQPKPVVD